MAKQNDLQAFVNNARERKKNEQLASQILGKNRRQSAPSNLKTPAGGSLASRVGVKKQRASLGTAAAAAKGNKIAGNVNGEWTHDLHHSVNSPARGTSLASRVTAPGSKPAASTSSKQKKTAARRAAALDRMDVDSGVQNQVNIRQAPPSKGISIRGLAGPYAVIGQNFAPGTTAADIESAMTPFGGEMESCRIVKTKPFIMVEMVFASREGGERVIETFNEKTADGRILKVYPKPTAGSRASINTAASQPKSTHAADQIVDGSMGFPEPNQRLYSDKMVDNDQQQQQQQSNGNERREDSDYYSKYNRDSSDYHYDGDGYGRDYDGQQSYRSRDRGYDKERGYSKERDYNSSRSYDDYRGGSGGGYDDRHDYDGRRDRRDYDEIRQDYDDRQDSRWYNDDYYEGPPSDSYIPQYDYEQRDSYHDLEASTTAEVSLESEYQQVAQ